MKIMMQKILQVGNSAAVTIPKQFLQEMGLLIGDRIDIRAKKNPPKIEIAPSYQTVLRKKSGITAKFVRSVEDFIRVYKPVLEELAKR